MTLRGSAIEARIYAEDEQGMPSGGLLETFSPPEGAGVRNDAGFEVGDEVPINYDAMLAKLIVYAPDRPSAVRRLRRSLSDYEILGPSSNLPLLRRIAAHPAFEAGETTIRFLEAYDLTEPQPEKPIPREAMILALAAELHRVPSSSDPSRRARGDSSARPPSTTASTASRPSAPNLEGSGSPPKAKNPSSKFSTMETAASAP